MSLRPRPFKLSRLRVGFQVLVHIALAGHVLAYYLLDWRRVGGLDFQDFFRSLLGEGRVTSAVLFAGTVYLLSFVWGRLFCSWGCHFGATQDLAAWVLRRLGWKPLLVKTRILHLAPFLVLAYVFVWPNVEVWVAEGWSFRGATLGGAGPWERLPGLVLSVLTFAVCGLGVLLFLGTRGFCRFVCPYGAVFRLTERVTPFRVRRVKPCGACGEADLPPPCTAVCPTAIDVHAETAVAGKVTSIDCVRCNLCVEACPHGALAYSAQGLEPERGFRPLPVLRAGPAARGITLAEEVFVLAVAVLSFLAADLVWGGHFLAACLALAEGFLALIVLRLLRRRDVSLGRVQLRAGGAWRLSGISAVALFLLTLVPIAQAAAFKHWRGRGLGLWRATVTEEAAALEGKTAVRLSAGQRVRLHDAAESLERAVSLVPFHLSTREALCHLYLALGDSRARPHAEELLRRGGPSPEREALLRDAYLSTGDLKRAQWIDSRAAAELKRRER